MSSLNEEYLKSIEEQLAARTNSVIAHLEENLQNSIRNPISQCPAEHFLTSKPLAVWLKVEEDNITEITMAPIDCSRDSAEAWNIPPLMMFTIYNREIYLNISTDGLSLNDGVVQKIKDLFGSNVHVCGLKLENTVFTANVVTLIGHFGITKIDVETKQVAFSPDIESLGVISSLQIIGHQLPANLKCITNSSNLTELHMELEFTARDKKFLNDLIYQWQSSERQITRWELKIPIQWKFLPRDYSRINSQDRSVLRLRLEESSLSKKLAVFTYYPTKSRAMSYAAVASSK